MQNSGGEEAEIAGRPRNVEAPRQRKRLAGIDRFGARELLEIALNEIGNPQKKPGPVGRRRAGPFRKRLLSRGHGQFDVAAIALRDLRIRLAGRWLDVLQVFSAGGLDESAVDEVADLEWLG